MQPYIYITFTSNQNVILTLKSSFFLRNTRYKKIEEQVIK